MCVGGWGGGGGGGGLGQALLIVSAADKGTGNGSWTCLRSKKPTIRPRVDVVLRLGLHTVAVAHESGLST